MREPATFRRLEVHPLAGKRNRLRHMTAPDARLRLIRDPLRAVSCRDLGGLRDHNTSLSIPAPLRAHGDSNTREASAPARQSRAGVKRDGA
jgi:hypothetical protein